MFQQWASRNKARFTGLIIPNVYGPFGHPYYNSVVATFCHQLTHNEQPIIEVDGNLKLIYIGELVTQIVGLIRENYSWSTVKLDIQELKLSHTTEIQVSIELIFALA